MEFSLPRRVDWVAIMMPRIINGNAPRISRHRICCAALHASRGLNNSKGILSAGYQMDVTDPQ
jgi:hypothetical protein